MAGNKLVKSIKPFIGLACLLLCLSPRASTTADPNYLDSVYLGISNGPSRLNPSGTTVWHKTQPAKVAAIAVDPNAGVVWTFGAGNLYQYDFAGNPKLAQPISIPIPTGANTATQNVVLYQPLSTLYCALGGVLPAGLPVGSIWASAKIAASPEDGSVWIGVADKLYQYSPEGVQLSEKQLPGLITSVAVDAQRSRIWVSTCRELRSFEADGTAVLTIPTGDTLNWISDIDYDQTRDQLLVGLSLAVQRFNPDGVKASEIALNVVSLFLEHISSDGIGNAWISQGPNLYYRNPTGGILASVTPVQLLATSLTGVSANQADQSVWVALPNSLIHFSKTGQVLKTVSLSSVGGGLFDKILALNVYEDLTPPTLQFTAPAEGAALNANKPVIGFSYSDIGTGAKDSSLTVLKNNLPLSVTCTYVTNTASCTPVTAFGDGLVALSATIKDFAGNVSDPVTRNFVIDTAAPTLLVSAPANDSYTNAVTATITGTVSEPSTVTVNGSHAVVQPNGSFTYSSVDLVEGGNSIQVHAVDQANNSAHVTLIVTRDTQAPTDPNGTLISTSTAGQTMSVSGAVGSVEPGTQVHVTNIRTGETVTVTAAADGSFSTQISIQPGDILSVTAEDRAGNVSGETTVGQPLPPDPSLAAAPFNPNYVTPFDDSTSFLYTGTNPIQTGVAPGAISAVRAAVVRGRVLKRDNTPLPDVVISIKDHPEFGQTRSRADGMFDMAINGGGYLIVNYSLNGYLPVQRQADVPWRDFALVDDVVMVALDPQVSIISLSQSTTMQVARGGAMTDTNGTRRATILFPTGVEATMTLPNGSSAPLSTAHVRATEFTVGANGPQAMPGDLPPTSAYTYAVELSADEAIAGGATHVNFSQPVSIYVDNFLGFPVGSTAPVGWYDRQKGAWVASENGVIVKILSIDAANGASLDISGSGQAATSTQLTALGITMEERKALGNLYPVGTSLWRASMTHFTSIDINWPNAFPADSIFPERGSLGQQSVPQLPDLSCHRGCIIEAEAQGLGEDIALSGVPYKLHYRSLRQSATNHQAQLKIRVSGASLPASLYSIQVRVQVAGRRFDYFLPKVTNQDFTFKWDGKDAYGRAVSGSYPVNVQVMYNYEIYYTVAVYHPGHEFGNYREPGYYTYYLARLIAPRTTSYSTRLTAIKPTSMPVGSWSLTPHNTYDPAGEILYPGNGNPQTSGDIGMIIERVAGGGSQPLAEGQRATSTNLGGFVYAVAVAPDGQIYFVRSGQSSIWRIDDAGLLHFVASGLSSAYDMKFGPDGNLYVAADTRIYKVTPAGQVQIIGGTGATSDYGNVGDGGLATQAIITRAFSIAVAADLSIYMREEGYCFNNASVGATVRKISPDGYISSLALPTMACNAVDDMAVGTDGTIYFSSGRNRVIRKITPQGEMTLFAGVPQGNATADSYGDGGPALQAGAGFPQAVAVDKNNNVYFYDSTADTIRIVTPDGMINRYAGGGPTSSDNGDKGAATQAHLSGTVYLSVAPDGNIYLSDSAQIRRVRPSMPAFSPEGASIASADGGELYQFDKTGRHLRTVDTRTGGTLYSFTYGASGALASITDSGNNTTTIDRDGNGNAMALTAPDGEQTAFTVDGNKYLSTISDPLGQAWHMTYHPPGSADNGGLLHTITDPKGQTATYSFDDLGHLTQDQDRAGGGWSLNTQLDFNNILTTMTSGEGRTTTYSLNASDATHSNYTTTSPDDTVSTRQVNNWNYSRTVTAPDGTVTTDQELPDPRFAMQSPGHSSTVKLPSGLTYSSKTIRTAVLSDSTNVLSLVSQTDTATLNGKTTQTVFTASTKTYVSTSPVGRHITATVDAQSRPQTSQLTGLLAMNYTYDTRGRLKTTTQGSGVDTRTTTLNYGTDGYLASVKDAMDRTVSYDHDATGRVTKQTLPDGRFIQYSYDANGNLTSLTPPGRSAHVFDYTAMDQQKTYTPPELPSGATVTQYSFNLDRQLTRITRPDTQVVEFNYDPAGRLDTLNIPGGSYTYAYAPGTGQLQNLTAPGGEALSFAYDGFLPKTETASGPIQGSVGWSYNNDFRVTGQSVNGSSLSFGYDNDGLLTQAGALALGRSAQNGLLSGTTLGSVSTSLAYNGFGELASETAQYQGNTLYQENITQRDKLGRISDKVETVQGATSTYHYEYDTAGRLATIDTDGVQAASYTYDANGNRTFRQTPSGTTEGTYDAQDRLLNYGGNSYTYTTNGELKTKTSGAQITQYDYDVLGNLTHVTLADGTSIDYVTDGRNRRVGRKVNNALIQGFLYGNQLEPIAELDQNNAVVSRFVYGSKSNIPDYMVKGGITYRIISDHLGSPILIINTSDGGIVQKLEYGAFGNVITDTNPGFQPFGFAGGIYDRDTKLTRFGARDYDAETGRWTAKDPIQFAGGDTNLYGYVLSDPINLIDPNGKLAWIGATAAAGAVIGGISGGMGALGAGANFEGIAVGAVTGVVVGGAAGIEAGVVATVAIGAGAAAVGEAVSQLITEGHINGNMLGVAAILGGWTAGASFGLTAIGVPLWPATILPSSMATILYGEAAHAGNISNQTGCQ